MPDTQATMDLLLKQPDFATQACPLPEAFIQWQLDTRRAMYDAITAGRHPRRHPAHLPVMITFEADGVFPVRVATKGAGLTPRDEILEQYIHLLEDTMARCEGRPWEGTLVERVAAVQALLNHPKDIDPRRLGFLEIFAGGTYRNLQRDPRVILHYTGDGPNYPSFQINGHAEILNPDDLRFQYIALTRCIFEAAPFHLPQPGYAAGYLVWVEEVFDKTPHSLKGVRTKDRVVWREKGNKGIRENGDKGIRGKSGEARGTSSIFFFSTFSLSSSPRQRTSAQEVTFQEILVPVDNSKYSAWAMDVALQIAGDFQSTVVGNHVYAARLHDQRFRDMEPGLPDEYQEPTILAHQRNLHDTLIDKGLKLISDSYLEALKVRCKEAGLHFESKTPEGKNYAQLVHDIETSRYDLVVMGARGQGSRKLRISDCGRKSEIRNPKSEMQLGSVCERLVRRVTRDVLVVKNNRPLGGTFVVGIDGSDRSFAALRVALALAEASGARVQAVAAYDPFLHKTLFHELEDALTEKARQVFNTEQQQKLHDKLIDSGIAKIYADHLETARRIAAEDRGLQIADCRLQTVDYGRKSEIRNAVLSLSRDPNPVPVQEPEIETHLLAGKPYPTLLQHVKEVQPTLLILGRTGVHADEGLDIGSNAENLLRLAPCHVLLVGRTFTPTWAETRQVVVEGLAWTAEALERLDRVPDFARGMARQAIEDYARQQGANTVDERLVTEARSKFGM